MAVRLPGVSPPPPDDPLFELLRADVDEDVGAVDTAVSVGPNVGFACGSLGPTVITTVDGGPPFEAVCVTTDVMSCGGGVDVGAVTVCVVIGLVVGSERVVGGLFVVGRVVCEPGRPGVVVAEEDMSATCTNKKMAKMW